MEVSIDRDQLKELLKAAVVEALEERRDMLRDVVEEAIEEIALAHAIQEGERTEVVGRDDVFKLLEGEA